jgi:hypothetical protein
VEIARKIGSESWTGLVSVRESFSSGGAVTVEIENMASLDETKRCFTRIWIEVE